MHRAFVFAVAIGIAAQLTAARAAPILDVFVTDLGDGYYGYDLWVDAADGEQRSLYAELSFNGEIQQQRALGRIDVDSDVQAAQFSELTEAAYAMEWDSYFSSPWTENSMSITSGPGNYAISAGTGGGSEFERLSLGHIVSRSPVAVSGSFGRAGHSYLLAGNFDPLAGLRQSIASEAVPEIRHPKNDPAPPAEPVAPVDVTPVVAPEPVAQPVVPAPPPIEPVAPVDVTPVVTPEPVAQPVVPPPAPAEPVAPVAVTPIVAPEPAVPAIIVEPNLPPDGAQLPTEPTNPLDSGFRTFPILAPPGVSGFVYTIDPSSAPYLTVENNGFLGGPVSYGMVEQGPMLFAAIPPGATIFNGVPEPSSLVLAIAAGAGLLLALRRSRRHVGAK